MKGYTAIMEDLDMYEELDSETQGKKSLTLIGLNHPNV